MSEFRLKDPLRSIRVSRQQSGKPVSPFFKRMPGSNPHNIGGVAPGEKRNPKGKGGFGDNPPKHVLEARRKGQIKPGECRNPYGRAGYKSVGITKVEKRRRSPESESIVKESREIQELARKHVPAAIERVAKILSDENSSDMAAIAAYHALADRGYGKPTQTNVNANMDMDAKPSEIASNDLDKRITEALERIERVTKRERETLESEVTPPNLRELH